MQRRAHPTYGYQIGTECPILLPVRAGADKLPLETKLLKIGMDGICARQGIFRGIGNNLGLGADGVIKSLGPITTTVRFSRIPAMAGCKTYGPSVSPQATTVSAVTECWKGAPSSIYVALDQICKYSNASFDSVRPARSYVVCRVSVYPCDAMYARFSVDPC
jgi:hypothetical protein